MDSRPSSRLGFYIQEIPEESELSSRCHFKHEYSPRSSSPLSRTYTNITQDTLPILEHTPSRLDYPEHGLSRASLLTRKWMWAMREQEWVEHTARQRDHTDQDFAYDGIHSFASPGSSPSSRPVLHETDCPPSYSKQPIPLSIHPRIGSLSTTISSFSSLTPPLSRVHQAHIDRWLMTEFGLAVWTIKKWLWGCELLAGEKRRTEIEQGENLRVSQSDCSIDSEKTLVDDDEEERYIYTKAARKQDHSCLPSTPSLLTTTTTSGEFCAPYISLLFRSPGTTCDLATPAFCGLTDEEEDDGPWVHVDINQVQADLSIDF